MRRIVITHNNGAWCFDRYGTDAVTADSPLRAAIAAMAYGECCAARNSATSSVSIIPVPHRPRE